MKKRTAILIQLAIWGVGYFLILNYTSTIGDFRKGGGPYWVAILFGTLMNQVTFYTTSFFLAPKLLRLKKVKTLIFSLVGAFIVINLFESFVDYNYLATFFSSERESFTVHLLYNSAISFFILLAALSYALLKYWIQNEKLKRVLLEEKLSTEMAFLKSQINPHFLFNVLNSFYAKSLKHDVPDLADGIAKLAELMRYMVYETNEDKVALEKEIRHLKNFTQVYQLRMAEEDEVLINFTINKNVEGFRISPMLLIPFVENAFKHGVEASSKSLIDISIEVQQNNLFFNVKNTIHKRDNGISGDSSGFGLDNLRKRLSVLYPDAHSLETTEENGHFTSSLHLQLDEPS